MIRRSLVVLAGLGVRDARVYRALVAEFERDPAFGAVLLAEYGDAQALPLLRRCRFVCVCDETRDDARRHRQMMIAAPRLERLSGAAAGEQLVVQGLHQGRRSRRLGGRHHRQPERQRRTGNGGSCNAHRRECTH